MIHERIAIIDGDHTVQRIWHTFSGSSLSARDGTPTGIIHGFLSSLCYIQNEICPTRIYVVWDSKSAHRRRLFDEYRSQYPEATAVAEQYKISREQNRDEESIKNYRECVWPQRDELMRTLPKMGIRQLFVKGVEGDDLMGIATDRLLNENETNHVVIISSDRDLYQLLDDRVTIFDPIKRKVYSLTQFRTDYKLEPSDWVSVRALSGDDRDDIPGVAGVGEKTAVKLLQNHQTLQGVIAACTGDKKKVSQNIVNSVEQIKFAAELSYILSYTDLDAVQQAAFDTCWQTDPIVDWDDIQEMLGIYELRKVAPAVNNFLATTEAALLATGTLEDLFAAWGECTRCPLHKTRTNIVRFRGPARSPIMILSEGPTSGEDFWGTPFKNPASDWMREYCLKPNGIDPNEVHMTHIVMCRAKGEEDEPRAATDNEVVSCLPRLKAQIRLVNPKVIIMIGDKTYKQFFPKNGKLGNDHGMPLTRGDFPGIVFIPVFSPAGLMHRSHQHSDVVQNRADWKKIAEIIQKD